jgi:hypothetical protein
LCTVNGSEIKTLPTNREPVVWERGVVPPTERERDTQRERKRNGEGERQSLNGNIFIV